jgi:hypothetical protein
MVCRAEMRQRFFFDYRISKCGAADDAGIFQAELRTANGIRARAVSGTMKVRRLYALAGNVV